MDCLKRGARGHVRMPTLHPSPCRPPVSARRGLPGPRPAPGPRFGRARAGPLPSRGPERRGRGRGRRARAGGDGARGRPRQLSGVRPGRLPGRCPGLGPGGGRRRLGGRASPPRGGPARPDPRPRLLSRRAPGGRAARLPRAPLLRPRRRHLPACALARRRRRQAGVVPGRLSNRPGALRGGPCARRHPCRCLESSRAPVPRKGRGRGADLLDQRTHRAPERRHRVPLDPPGVGPGGRRCPLERRGRAARLLGWPPGSWPLRLSRWRRRGPPGGRGRGRGSLLPGPGRGAGCGGGGGGAAQLSSGGLRGGARGAPGGLRRAGLGGDPRGLRPAPGGIHCAEGDAAAADPLRGIEGRELGRKGALGCPGRAGVGWVCGDEARDYAGSCEGKNACRLIPGAGSWPASWAWPDSGSDCGPRM